MYKVRPWCGQLSDRGRLKSRADPLKRCPLREFNCRRKLSVKHCCSDSVKFRKYFGDRSNQLSAAYISAVE